MPSQILHTLFGEDVIAGICRRMAPRFADAAGMEKIQKIPAETRQGPGRGSADSPPDTHRKAFALGCQGPDIFYHSQGRRPVGLEYGTLLHRRDVGTFAAELLRMGLPAPPNGVNALGVYALGFMTHAMLDRMAHPYIVYKSGWLSPSNPETHRFDRSHSFFERIIDVLMLKLLRGEEVSAWDQEGILAETCENPPPGLKELLVQALVRAYPERAGKDMKLGLRIENTFHDCAFFYRLTAPAQSPMANPGTRRFLFRKRHLAYLYPKDLPGHIDFLNLERRLWYYPAGEGKEDMRSFPELYTEAVNTAADSFAAILSRYLEEGFFPIKEAAQAIGNGGLSIVDEAGKPCAPNRADPLPLDEVLNQQAALRGLNDSID